MRCVALLNRKAVNAGVPRCSWRCGRQQAATLVADPLRQGRGVVSRGQRICYRMSGEIDYLIRLALPDIEAYDAFYKRLIAKIELSDITSMFAMEEIESTTRLPLIYHFAPSLAAAASRIAPGAWKGRVCIPEDRRER